MNKRVIVIVALFLVLGGGAVLFTLPSLSPAPLGSAPMGGGYGGNGTGASYALASNNTRSSGVLADAVTVNQEGGAPGSVPPAQPALERRIVLKNASVQLVVKDTAENLASIASLATKLGGWVVNSNSYQNAGRGGTKLTYGSITIRVPAEKLDEAMQQIKTGAESVTAENVTGQDVTQQYTDLTSQLTNLQAAEEQLRKIMDAAVKTDDVLAVYKQLVDVRGRIEVIKGQIKFYDESAAFSSITISLTPSEADQPLQIGGWQPGATIKNAVTALVNALQGLADVLIWLVLVALPLLLILGIPGLLIYRVVRRRVNNRSTPAAPPAPSVS
jgi:hypothetical protein